MNTETILRLLHNSGFHNVSMDSEFVYMEDPSCVIRSFETFLEYVWVAIAFITAFMLMGWAISMIRGAKHDNLLVNLRNLIILFGSLTLVMPIMDFIYGDNLLAHGCKTVQVPMNTVNELMQMRQEKLSGFNEFGIFENIDIYDSGANDTVASITIDTDENINIAPEQHASDPNNDEHNDVVNIANVAISATEDNRDVIYTLPDGSRIKRIGGTRAWRNSNPGNIKYSDFARRVGAIGKAGNFAVFPDEATGMYAIETLLRTDSYNKLTIKDAISRYAPPFENDTAAYQKRLTQLTGLSIDRSMSSLSASELTKVARAIRTIEGWTPGQIQRI